MVETIEFRKAGVGVLLILQVIFIILFAFFVQYPPKAKPVVVIPDVLNGTTGRPIPVNQDETEMNNDYPLFEDINVMIFIGFGFLVSFFKRFAHSGAIFTILLAAVAIQWAVLIHGFFYWSSNHVIYITLHEMAYCEEASVAVLITLGIVLGRTTPVGLVFMSLVEICAYVLNEYVCVHVLKSMDHGGSMYLHGFGAYFGLAVSAILALKTGPIEDIKMEVSSYIGDLTALIGTLFLWVFWPSFLGVGSTGDTKYRIIINTYLALLASCVSAVAATSAFNKEFKFEMPQIQNATLAGGVAIGATVNTMIHPYGAMIIGTVSGVLSCAGFSYVQKFLHKTCHIHDSCGAHNLHGLPGLLGGVTGIFTAAFATAEIYGAELSEVYPAIADEGRSPGVQAMFQVIGIFVTLAVSITAGILAGVFLRGVFPKYADNDKFYKDEEWVKEEEE